MNTTNENTDHTGEKTAEQKDSMKTLLQLLLSSGVFAMGMKSMANNFKKHVERKQREIGLNILSTTLMAVGLIVGFYGLFEFVMYKLSLSMYTNLGFGLFLVAAALAVNLSSKD